MEHIKFTDEEIAKVIMNMVVISNNGGKVERNKNKYGWYDTDENGNFVEQGKFTPNKLYEMLKNAYDNKEWWKFYVYWKNRFKTKTEPQANTIREWWDKYEERKLV